jgi:ADP-heptose:LPS heptosyltransferase
VNLVVLKVNHLGDNVVFVPAIQSLRRLFPDWHITLLTTPNEASLYGGPLGPQEVLVCPKGRFDKSYRTPWVLARWIWTVRGKRPDACLVSFDQGNAAHAVARFSGARVRVGANLDHVRVPRSLTELVSIPEDGRPVTWNWEMARAVARAIRPQEVLPPKPPAPDLRHLLSQDSAKRGNRRRIVVHAGAGGALNQWGHERFAAVARSLSSEYEVIWIRHGTIGPSPEGAVDTPVNELGELARWLAGADLFLGNNSGPMHLANALGCPGVCVSGPSAGGWDPYWYPERWTILRHPNLYCAPCERIDRSVNRCANLANPMACLDFWTHDTVLRACRERLERNGGPPP